MNIKRCNLSGIYLFDRLEGDEKKKPTCIEDCSDNVREKWLESLDSQGLIRTIHILCRTIKDISNQFGIIASHE